ncbi:MAG: PKD domain-containing protein, partial [Bacteroidota bacterium]
MRIKLITGLLILLPFLGFSQGEFNKWYFGVNAGIDFNTIPPSGLPAGAMNTMHASVSVADSLGNLLFYSQGMSVYNRNHQVMPNGIGLFGSQNTQAVYAVKKPGSENLYFLFTIYSNLMPLNYGLYYSVIDMNLNGGLGDVVSGSKNIPVAGGEDVINGIHGARHFNNQDAWIVVRKTTTNEYAAYRVTSSGVSTTPVLSSCSIVGCGFNSCGYVELKISQDGTRYVFVSNNPQQNMHVAEVGLFNCNTGVLTPAFQFRPVNPLNLAYVDPRNIEFSPDSKRLYVATTYYAAGTSRFIFQYDLSFFDSTQFMQSQLLLSSTHEGQSLQLGSDGKIYQTIGNVDSLNVINNPNVHGLGCNFQTNAIALASGTFNHSGLPQFLQRYKAYIHSSGQCQGHPVNFTSDIWPPADTTRWNFGDPTSGTANISTLTTPSHLYANPGTYTVTLYVRHNDNRTDTTRKAITILPSPSPVITGPGTAAIGQTTTYTTQAGMSAYTWSVSSGGTITGGGTSTDNTVSITWNTAGIHHVFVNYANSNGCTAASPAVIQVTVGSGPPALYEYWFAAPAITNQTISPSTLNWTDLNKPILLYLMTADGPATVMIDQPANSSFVPIIKTVNNDSAREVDLTPFIESVETKPANSILNTGLHITSDKRINVIYEIQSPHNAATYTLAGKDALGYEFIIPAQNHLPNFPNCDPPARNVFDIVATEDSTVVHILPKQPIIGHPPADTFAIILNRGQTWSGRAASGDSSKHLGGSFVFADKPVAITVTDDALFVSGSDESTFDIAGDQLMPRDLCGTEFIPVAFLDAFKPKLWIYAFENQTYVTMVDTSYTQNDTLNRGEWTEFILDLDPNLPISTGYAGYLHSNKPALVYELTGRGVRISASGNASDQYAASVLPPITCTGSKRVCLSRTPPFGSAFSVNNLYWTIVTKNGNQGNIQNNRGLTTANGGFRTVPGTNGEYVFGISAIGGTGALAYMNIIFTSIGDRFQFASGSSTDNFFTNNYSYSKFSYFSEYSKLSLGPDHSMCPGDSIFLDAGYGRNSYQWSTGETTQTIWVKTAGTYWVSTTEPDCNLSDTIVVSYYPITPVNLGPDRTICLGDSTLLNAGAGRAWYLWNTGANTQSIWV